eukprot:TRINITY_DN6699_c1_g1_i1.p1 TRINITY_DN6699_c1_g1~~TRINITY_DN6699_c1_g1_i1.p1  ORF type:complete len:568 (+),score=228.50 TRINITY_DN6699_c1_g1_i1:76-1779(+)
MVHDPADLGDDPGAPSLSSAAPSEAVSGPGSGTSSPERRRMRRANAPTVSTTPEETVLSADTCRNNRSLAVGLLSPALSPALVFTPQYQKPPFDARAALAAAAVSSPLLQGLSPHAGSVPGLWQPSYHDLGQCVGSPLGSSPRDDRRHSAPEVLTQRGIRPKDAHPDEPPARSPVLEPCPMSGYEAPVPSPLSPAHPMPTGIDLLGALAGEPQLPLSAVTGVQPGMLQTMQDMQRLQQEASFMQRDPAYLLSQLQQSHYMLQQQQLAMDPFGGWGLQQQQQQQQQQHFDQRQRMQQQQPPKPSRVVPAEERVLTNAVEALLLNKHTNKFQGSVPVVVVQRVVAEQCAAEYKAVVEQQYHKSFHAFLRAHSQLRVFHYDLDVIQERGLHHCSPHEGRLAFSDVPDLELIDRDLGTAAWKAQRWREVLDEVEEVIQEQPMQMRALLQHFRDRPNAEEYSGTLPSNHALRQLLKKEPHRFVITHDATVKLPAQLTDEEREEWLSKSSEHARRRARGAPSAPARHGSPHRAAGRGRQYRGGGAGAQHKGGKGGGKGRRKGDGMYGGYHNHA